MNEGEGTPVTVVPSRDAAGKGEVSLSGQADPRPEVVSATTPGMPEEPSPKAEPPLAGGEQFSNRPDKEEPPKVPRRDRSEISPRDSLNRSNSPANSPSNSPEGSPSGSGVQADPPYGAIREHRNVRGATPPRGSAEAKRAREQSRRDESPAVLPSMTATESGEVRFVFGATEPDDVDPGEVIEDGTSLEGPKEKLYEAIAKYDRRNREYQIEVQGSPSDPCHFGRFNAREALQKGVIPDLGWLACQPCTSPAVEMFPLRAGSAAPTETNRIKPNLSELTELNQIKPN